MGAEPNAYPVVLGLGALHFRNEGLNEVNAGFPFSSHILNTSLCYSLLLLHGNGLWGHLPQGTMHFSSSIITGRQLAHFLCSPKHCQVPCHLLERLPGFCLPPNYVRGLELCFPIKPWSCKNLTTSEMYQRVSSACPRHTVYVAEKGILWN